MATEAEHRRVGPECGRLLLRTSRAGVAAQAGHDLTLEVTRWSGDVVLAGDSAAGTVTVTAFTGSLRVLEGTGGVKPLSERDRRDIVQNARRLLDADRRPEAEFTGTGIVTDDDGGGVVDGTLTLLGRRHPLRLRVTRLEDGRYRATGTIVQSQYGVRPYTAFFGALKLADPVAVEAEVDLPEPLGPGA
ncbi:YceI family protein [Sphaerisporangium sp. TRM90804]|uniref:YceI family protein n=1 Tax=Sphaerisporangium sp. TRM90804 TaxID=3031113 RepID=UPI002448F449|nr:YceI family protein [Sphaerisporangium sp. TRM90804]MDH2430525.1 YceI family protein [Sphaerisporangium sp. TRM90804]